MSAIWSAAKRLIYKCDNSDVQSPKVDDKGIRIFATEARIRIRNALAARNKEITIDNEEEKENHFPYLYDDEVDGRSSWAGESVAESPAALLVRHRTHRESGEHQESGEQTTSRVTEPPLIQVHTGRSYRRYYGFLSRVISVLARGKTISQYPRTGFRVGRRAPSISTSSGMASSYAAHLETRVRRYTRRPPERARFSAMLAEEARVLPLSPDRKERGGRRQRTKGELRVRVRERGRERGTTDATAAAATSTTTTTTVAWYRFVAVESRRRGGPERAFSSLSLPPSPVYPPLPSRREQHAK